MNSNRPKTEYDYDKERLNSVRIPDEDKEILDRYIGIKWRSNQQFREYKKKIVNARKAYRQIAPDDILNSIQAVAESGNGGERQTTDFYDDRGQRKEIDGDNNNSVMIFPMYSAICNKMIETLHALPPRYEWAANDNAGIATAWALELELMKCYTKSNIGAKIPMLLWHLIVDGIFAQQTVFRQMSEKIKVKGQEKPESVYDGGTIDFIIYDPLTCYFDWDADITDFRRTSKFFIATISDSVTYDGLVDVFGKDAVERMKSAGVASYKSGDYGDVYKNQMERDNGFTEPIESLVWREYYTKDGRCYSIINDCYIIKKSDVESGVADQIPINIGVAYYDPDSKLGSSLWERVRWGVALMSQAINQVADNNSFNCKAPFFTSGEVQEDLSRDASEGRRLIHITSRYPGQTDVTKMVTQFLLPEITPGAEFMFAQGMNGIFYVTGTNSMAFGIQDKQIRTAQAAEMIGASLVRSDSDIAKKIECSFFNPVTWDFLRIFYANYDAFPTFKENNIPKDFLKNYKSVRVVNGSYLTADKAERLGKLQQVLQLAQLNPQGMRLSNLYHDLIQAIGFINPSMYLKSEGEIALEQLFVDLGAKAAAGFISDEEMKQAQAAIMFLMQTTQKAAMEGGDNVQQ